METIDIEKLIAHLKEKWGTDGRCPQCKTGAWQVDKKIFQLMEFQGSGPLTIGGGVVVPLLPVACSNCGNTVLINAIISKMWQKPAEQSPVEAAAVAAATKGLGG